MRTIDWKYRDTVRTLATGPIFVQRCGMTTGHVVLLGDSIFDNRAYVNGGPDVVEQLRGELSPGWKATLLALDGDVIAGVHRQLLALPDDATHLVVSAGGNDALGFAHLLEAPARSVAQALALFADAQERFAADYELMAKALSAKGLPAAVCTIYDTPSSGPAYRMIRTALTVFNDSITRAAFSRGISLLDLRLICNNDGDYANPIEPSARGGAKIARAIAALVDPTRQVPRSTVIGGA
jgi:GDSL-like Lipase/Acylhydrolase family